MRTLQDAQLYRAVAAHDPRFDGVIFVGVTSTRIYCRPICPALTPRADRCRFFSSAAAAERRGFRPCLRCRPELAPGAGWAGSDTVASVDAVAQLGRTAGRLIASGALDRGNLETLADQLGVSSRHLRRAVERELGATPVELAQTRRLLTAKQLLTDTDLPLSRVAFASGFRSLRRFNALFRERYRLVPGEMRRGARVPADGAGSAAMLHDGIRLSLASRPPFDWPSMLSYLALRATPGVEWVGREHGGVYARTVQLHDASGIIVVRPAPSRRQRSRAGSETATLELELSPSLLPVLVPLIARVRQLLDLDAEPVAIGAHLGHDPLLAPLVARRPGLRVPGAFDGFELAVRTVLGQQVSVRGASTLAGRLAHLGDPLPAELGSPQLPSLTRLPVRADIVLALGTDRLARIGLPRARAACILELARAVKDGTIPELGGDGALADHASFARRFQALPGIGEWTAEYVAMRALRWPDAFPHGDLGLRKAAGNLTPGRLRLASDAWRPWRAYAAQHLWTSLDDRDVAADARANARPRRQKETI